MMEDKSIDELIHILETSTDEDIRRRAIYSLGQIATGDERAIFALVKLLETTTDWYTRRQTAESLGQIGTGDKTAISALVNLMEISTNELIRSEAAYCLGKIGTGNEVAISALVKLLETTTDEDIRIQATYNLGQIGKGNKTAISALVKLLETSTDESTRRRGAYYLGQIGTGDERAISALVKLLETTTDEKTCIQSAESLGQIATGDERAILALIKLLETTTDEDTRSVAADTLGEMVGISSPILLKPDQIAPPVIVKRQWLDSISLIFAVFSLLCSLILLILPNSGLSSDTIKLLYIFLLLIPLFWLINELYLKKIFFRWFNRQRNQEVAVWVQILSSQDEFIQWQAIKKLGAIANGNKSAIVALINILKTSKNEFIQWQAVKSLGNIGKNNKKAMTAIIKFIETTSNEFIQWQSLEQLHHFKFIHFSNVLKIRKKLKINSSPSIKSEILKLQQKLDPLERLILKPFNQKLIKGVRQEYSVKTIFGDSIVNYIDRMQEGRDITNRRSLINSCLEVYQTLVRFALQNTDFNRAFFYTEIFRNRYLVERIAQQDAPLPQTISPALARKVQTAKQTERKTLQTYTDAISKHRQETENNRSETELETLSQAWENAKQTLEDLYLQVAEIEPEFIAKTKVYPIHFEEVQQLLPADNAIIEFFFTETELITLLILPGTQSPLIPETLRIKLKPNHLETLAEDWKAYLEDKNKSETNTTDTTIQQLPQRIDHLGKLLNFTDLNQYIPRQIKQLIIVPNNYLHLFPIHALPWNENQRLIDCFSVRYFPNLHIWKICQNRQRTRDSFLGIENPTADKDLIFAKAEIGSICQTGNFKKTKVLPHDKAKKQDILQDAKNFHCFHFSGHAEYNFTNPLESYLELSKTHSENLTLSTIFTDLHLPNADLATLSACCTGVVDAFQPTDECLGIATGFLLAGAKAVVSSLWKVNSIATAFLLDEFYRQLEQTQDKAVALQTAQNWLRTCTADKLTQRANEWDLSKIESKEQFRLDRALKRLQGCPFENPYYWAAFILTGC